MRYLLLRTFAAAMVFMIVGLGLSIGLRRQDVTVAQTFWAGSDLSAHPERYVKPRWLWLIRFLNLVGVGLFALVGVLLLYGTVRLTLPLG